MEKYTDFTNVKQLTHNQLSSYFNFPTGLQQGLQQLSETTVAPVDPVPVPRHLELVKCSLCNRTVEMYIDIHEDVFKRFYCSSCISNKKLPPFPTKREYSDLSTHGPSKHTTNSHGSDSNQTKSQATQSSFSSPSCPSSIVQSAKKCSKPKQPKHSHCNSSMVLPYNGTDCCPSSMVNRCNRYGHFLDEPSCHSHHCCDRERINKRSWSVANRRPWTAEQKETIFSYFGLHIESRRSIGKEDIIPLMELKKDMFVGRTWKEIKWVYYHHLKVVERRKSLQSGSEGELAARHQAVNTTYMDEDLAECSNSPNNTTYSARANNDDPVPV